MNKSTEVFLETIMTKKHDEIVELANAIASNRKHKVTLTNDGLYDGESYGPLYYWADFFDLDSESLDTYKLKCLVAVIVDQLSALGYGEYNVEEDYPYEDSKREMNCIIRKRIH